MNFYRHEAESTFGNTRYKATKRGPSDVSLLLGASFTSFPKLKRKDTLDNETSSKPNIDKEAENVYKPV